ncbi:hypothetical protein M430DRAFT_200848 [Amorphotheca resinae ATCC 22711]|uniref:Uncharacterized protein n=1 Tax=Amorphotheca resinae ATCC 22711 TaxID=857342 RepID=A0A2T3BAK2_AMORE|nr:hypothetical protein M430DRAFT_200848 [Amorphotheca resinae ATCC 22711]PSS25328.1 hypothetical protein M430DRAFT_200848 [Amorphotheca resinae ATCC 22711]
MSTPHRGLPPPAAMTLPQPPQQPPQIGQPPLSQPLGQLPAPLQQWQGGEESMRNWLLAKAEEDKRKQEEEKTRQESLRLEQRKIEQDMLRTSLNGGIPPYMIPMVFAGMGGGNLPATSLEWAQHYLAQAQLQQQQPQPQPQQHMLPSQSHALPEQLQRGDPRVPPYSGQQHPAAMTLPSTPVGPPGSQQSAGFVPSYQMSPASRSRSTIQAQGAVARPPQASHLPRLNTGEIAAGGSMQALPGQSGHPLQQTQTAPQQETHSSPSIYFHHWQPPTSQAGSSANQPSTPSESASPKKRKATGPHQSAPQPTSQPRYTSPPFSQTGSISHTPTNRRRGHSRQRSDMSARGLDSYGRPGSRHRYSESSFTTRSMASPAPEQGPAAAASVAPRRRSGGSNPVSSILEHSETRPQSQSQAQQAQRDSEYPAGSETRHEERRMTPEGGGSR